MKIVRLLVPAFICCMNLNTYAQKTISEGTVTYDISIQSKKTGVAGNGGLNGAKSTLYLKGSFSRTDMTSALGTETTIYNAKTGNAVILKEYSGQKLMITLTKENWESSNKKFDGIVFENAAETKVIDGYNCKRTFAKLKDGSSISVYYATDLIANNKQYNQAFENLPGFPMEYEFETDKLVIKYQLVKIDFSPLSSSKFDFPKSGYRIISYDENKSGNATNL